MATARDVQVRLFGLGYDPGPIDGVWGPKTRRAVRDFQRDNDLLIDGIVGPRTLAALNADRRQGERVILEEAPWYGEARRKMGLHEVRDRSALMAWLRSDGRTLGDPARLPWCGDFVETAILRALPDEPLPANPYLARNWMRFGRPLTVPAPGAILVFWRGQRRGTSGHVGFYVGEDTVAYRVLGGNQSNAVTETRIGKERLLGIRWPVTYPLPGSGRVTVAAAGDLSTNEA